MKIEINIVKKDDIPYVVVTSPESEEMIAKVINADTYLDLIESELELRAATVSELLAPEYDGREKLSIQVWKPEKGKNEGYGISVCSEDECGEINDIYINTISKSTYKKFKKATSIYKLEMAYKVLKEAIDNHIVPVE